MKQKSHELQSSKAQQVPNKQFFSIASFSKRKACLVYQDSSPDTTVQNSPITACGGTESTAGSIHSS